MGARAYVALFATLSFKLEGQPQSRPGIFTFTQGGEWKIDAQAWGDLS